MHDLVINGGTIVDGTGAAPREGNIAVDGGKIAAIGADVGAGREEIDARGKLVTPGWVDIHTHYDGQATWDPYLAPSSWPGRTGAKPTPQFPITTVVTPFHPEGVRCVSQVTWPS